MIKKIKKLILKKTPPMIYSSHMTFVAFANFGQKLLCKEKMIPEVQNYYLGLFNAIPAFILMLIERKTGISNIIYISYAFSNGISFLLG